MQDKKAELEYPPCMCKWCADPISDWEFFGRDALGRPMCAKCYEIEAKERKTLELNKLEELIAWFL